MFLLDEENNQQVQRFDTPMIRDYDFPKESGDQPMPGQQAGASTRKEPEATPITSEQVDQQIHQQQPQEAQPAAAELEPIKEAEIPPATQEPQAAEHPAEKAPEVTAVPKYPYGQPCTPAPELVKRLDPKCIPKFVNQLIKPPVYCPVPSGSEDENRLFVIEISEFKQQILPAGFPETTVFGYGGTVMDEETCQIRYSRNSPGATFEAVRNVPIRVKWINKLSGPHPFTSDLKRAQSSVPIVTHLHGGKVSSVLNGYPDAWFTSDGKTGPAYSTSISSYPNNQEAATLWYHDNASGVSRLNVYAGLSGIYLLRSGKEFTWRRESLLPTGRYEIPLIIQDRSFNTDGSLSFNPKYVNDTIMVNGKVWPNLNVERRQYRFRLLNASNTRFYKLGMSNGMKVTKIGADSGFLPEPAALELILLAPSERADILVDFSDVLPGTKIIMINEANTSFPKGSTPDLSTTGQIMQFSIPLDSPVPVKPKKLPSKLTI